MSSFTTGWSTMFSKSALDAIGPEGARAALHVEVDTRGRSEEVALNQEQIARARSFMGVPWVRLCVDALLKMIFRDEPRFIRGDAAEAAQLSSAFKEMYQLYWEPFARECVLTILTLGVLPLKVVPLDGGDSTRARVDGGGGDARFSLVPVVPDMNLELRQYYDMRTERWNYRAYRPRYKSGMGSMPGGTIEMEIDPDIIVLSAYDARPVANGDLRSIVSVLGSEIDLMTRLDDYNDDAAAGRAHPVPLVRMPSVAQGAASSKETSPMSFVNANYDENFVHMSDARDAVRQEDAVQRTRAQYAELNRARTIRLMSRTSGNRVAPDRARTARDLERGALSSQIVSLPPGAQLERPFLPEVVHDFSEIQRSRQKIICALFGISMSHIMPSDHKTVAGNVDGERQTVNETVMLWRRRIGSVLTLVYGKILGDQESDSLVARLREQGLWSRVSASRSLTERVADDNRVRVVFDSSPALELDDLNRLYYMGVIGIDGLRKLASSRASIPPELIESGKAREFPEELRLVALKAATAEAMRGTPYAGAATKVPPPPSSSSSTPKRKASSSSEPKKKKKTAASNEKKK